MRWLLQNRHQILGGIAKNEDCRDDSWAEKLSFKTSLRNEVITAAERRKLCSQDLLLPCKRIPEQNREKPEKHSKQTYVSLTVRQVNHDLHYSHKTYHDCSLQVCQQIVFYRSQVEFGMVLGLIWDRFRICFGSIWIYFGITLGHVGIFLFGNNADSS